MQGRFDNGKPIRRQYPDRTEFGQDNSRWLGYARLSLHTTMGSEYGRHSVLDLMLIMLMFSFANTFSSYRRFPNSLD